MDKAQWYFDVISPFSYLHFHGLQPLRERLQIEAVPVLFAGLLKHWGNVGPAEVPPKRLHTYQYCVWAAHQQGLPFRMPARHPFKSLAAQRLLTAVGATDASIETALDFVWNEGRDAELELDELALRLGIVDATAATTDPEIKRRLIANTQAAIDAGVFGVPTLRLRDRVFWGSDTVAWASQFLDEPDLFDRPDYVRAALSEFGTGR